MNKTLIGIVVVLVVTLGGWAVLRNTTPNETGPIKIGFVSPLTGDAAAYGEPIRDGIMLAVEEINQAGGIDGRQVEIVYEDGKCDGKDAASAAQKLINVDGVKYITGIACSAEAFAIVPVAEPAKVLVLSPGASAPKLSASSPYFLRNNPNDNVPAVAMADYLSKTYKSAAIISEKTPYSQGFKDVFSAQAQKDNLKLVSVEDYDTNSTDFRTILSKVRAANPEVIFINPQTSANLLRIAKQAREMGINTPFASAVFNDSETVSTPVMNGTVMAVPPGLSTEGKGSAFLAAYKAKYGDEPTYPFYAGAGYDDIYIIKQAIEAVGDDSTKVAEYLHKLQNYTGTIGTYGFDQNGDLAGITSILQKIENGKLITL